ncbi:MAG TPA: hypothetical protein PLB68_10710, partial [Candidatus Aminicenantes bacterium]|nr:hypothetical protein [Candidatus Aminicenantes bacterium]
KVKGRGRGPPEGGMSGKAGRMKIYNKRKRPEREKGEVGRRKERKRRREGRAEEMEGTGEGSRRLPGLRRGRKESEI